MKTQDQVQATKTLVTQPDQLAEALRNAPPDWPRKNLQFVLA